MGRQRPDHDRLPALRGAQHLPQRRTRRDLARGREAELRSRRQRVLLRDGQRPVQCRGSRAQRERIPRRCELLRVPRQGRARCRHIPHEPKRQRLGNQGGRLLHPLQPDGARRHGSGLRLRGAPRASRFGGHPRSPAPDRRRGQAGEDLRRRPRQSRQVQRGRRQRAQCGTRRHGPQDAPGPARRLRQHALVLQRPALLGERVQQPGPLLPDQLRRHAHHHVVHGLDLLRLPARVAFGLGQRHEQRHRLGP